MGLRCGSGVDGAASDHCKKLSYKGTGDEMASTMGENLSDRERRCCLT